MQEFKYSDPENVTIDNGQLGYGPGWGKTADEAIQSLPVIAYAVVKPTREFHGGPANVFVHPVIIRVGAWGLRPFPATTSDVGREEGLQRDGSRDTPWVI